MVSFEVEACVVGSSESQAVRTSVEVNNGLSAANERRELAERADMWLTDRYSEIEELPFMFEAVGPRLERLSESLTRRL